MIYRATAAERAAITREGLTEMAQEARKAERGQFSAAVAAIKEIGILSGIRIERSERGRPREFDDVSTDEIISELRHPGWRSNSISWTKPALRL